MANDAKATLSVAAAFAAAMLATPAAQANVPNESIEISGAQAVSRDDTETIQPSPAALQRLEEAAQTAFFWWPWPPRWVEVWPEVTHVESIRTA